MTERFIADKAGEAVWNLRYVRRVFLTPAPAAGWLETVDGRKVEIHESEARALIEATRRTCRRWPGAARRSDDVAAT